MPRQPDPDLENRILDAAQRLWKKGGEESLTLRAVAKAARTNTPAVYRRFRDRDDIIRGLLQRTRLEIAAVIRAARSVEDGCEKYLDYALQHPHEYELFYRYDYELCHSPRAHRAGYRLLAQPARAAIRQRLEEQLGKSPGGHERLLMGLWMVGHGAATLLIGKSILPQDAVEARAAFRASIAALLSQQI